MTEEVLRQLAMDSDSDMEPKNDDSLPDHGDDFVVESSNEAMLDEPVYFVHVCVCVKKSLESICLLNYPPFQQGCFFVTMTTAHSITQKQIL